MIKIAFIVPIVAHYRLSFFEKLVKNNPEYEWCVFHGEKKKEDGRPAYSGNLNFPNKSFEPKIFKIYPFGIVYNKTLFSSIKKYNPDIVITTGIAGDISNRLIINWIKRKRKKSVLWVCSWDSGMAKNILKKFKLALVKNYFRKATHFIAYSTHAKNYVHSFGIDYNSISIAYNGIELFDFKQNESETYNEAKELRLKNCNSEKDFIFLYVGGLIKEKKIDLLIAQFIELNKSYKNAKLWIVGDGPLASLVISAAERNENITFFGRIIEGVNAYFAASDCFVLPGAGGLALNQALFWRKFCIAGFADGTEEDLVIDGVTGFRFPPEDSMSLYGSMEKALNLTNERKIQFGENARKIIEDQNNVDKMLEVFQTVIRSI